MVFLSDFTNDFILVIVLLTCSCIRKACNVFKAWVNWRISWPYTYVLGLARFLRVLCFCFFIFIVKVKLTVPLLCALCILPENAIPEVTYTVLGGTLNHTHSLIHWWW